MGLALAGVHYCSVLFVVKVWFGWMGWSCDGCGFGMFIKTATQSLSLIGEIQLPNRYRDGRLGNRYRESLS